MKILLYVLLVYAVLLLVLYFFQRSLMYFPDHTVYTPREAGVPEMQEITLKTNDGFKIKGWYARPIKTNYPTIVYFHGNGGNFAGRGMLIKPYLDEGYGVFLLSYRGYGGNPGSPSEEGLYQDARSALKFLEGKPIILFGESIGCAVAIQMATEFDVKGMILQGAFPSTAELAKIHYSFFLPSVALIRDKYDSLSKVSQLKPVPILFLHGKEDTIVPIDLARTLYEALPQPKEGEFVRGKGHNDLFEPERVLQFLKKVQTPDFQKE